MLNQFYLPYLVWYNMIDATLNFLYLSIPLGPLLAGIVIGLASGFLIWWFVLRHKQPAAMTTAKEQDHGAIDRHLQHMYNNITHEFRTPLTVIKGLTEQIEGNVEKKSIIQRNSDTLLRLINQMLDLAKAEKGQLVLTPQHGDMVGFINYIIESYQSWAESRKIRLHFLPDVESCKMDFDHEMTQDLFGNLISNALKYSNPDGDVYVSIFADEHHLTLAVRDTGIGIDPKKLPNVFDRFYQVEDGNARTHTGTGIGLALCQEYVQLMQGKISVKSELGVGSTFTVRLPITRHLSGESDFMVDFSEKQEHSVYPLPANNDHASADQLLIVEDNPDVRFYLAGCLGDEFSLQFAENGQQGIEMALEQVPDLVISDVMMPIKSGLQLCDVLKNHLATSHIPIVMLTAKVDDNSRLQGLEKGADAYLAKPFNQAELLIRVRSLITQRKRIQRHFGGLDIQADVPPEEDAFIAEVRKIVERELDNEHLDVQWLARELALSRSQLYRKIKALTGRSIASFIRMVRLQRAREVLENSTKTVSEIAYQVGFNDLGYFSKSFSEEFGISPKETRK